jgi:flavin-binding protein dodecin
MATTKIIELIGSSPNSWEEAAQNGLTKAAETVKGIKGIDAISFTAKVENNKIIEYHTNMKIAFVVD